MITHEIINSPGKALVADASAMISITASALEKDIITALPNPIFVPDEVVNELDAGRAKGYANADQLDDLVNNNLVNLISKGEVAEIHFGNMTIGAAKDTLGDGESATIACALEIGAIPLLDERKARRICRDKFPQLNYGCTIDVIAHPAVQKLLGQDNLALAVNNALDHSRMRILEKHEDWVIGVIGPQKAVGFASLSRAARDRANSLLNPP